MIKDIFRIAAMKRTISEQHKYMNNLNDICIALTKEKETLREAFNDVRRENDLLMENLMVETRKRYDLNQLLVKIAKQETKTANATVKRMANMAREGLGK